MIRELENMCSDLNFDRARAAKLVKQIDVNQEFVDSKHHVKTVLLDWAATWTNVPMVQLLLENGADPNHKYNNETENVLWNLQHAETDPQKSEKQLQIVRLLLEHGADPHLELEGETLLEWAHYCWFELDEGEQAEYRWKFICLLEEYAT